jgi:hypothetical protein
MVQRSQRVDLKFGADLVAALGDYRKLNPGVGNLAGVGFRLEPLSGNAVFPVEVKASTGETYIVEGNGWVSSKATSVQISPTAAYDPDMPFASGGPIGYWDGWVAPSWVLWSAGSVDDLGAGVAPVALKSELLYFKSGTGWGNFSTGCTHAIAAYRFRQLQVFLGNKSGSLQTFNLRPAVNSTVANGFLTTGVQTLSAAAATLDGVTVTPTAPYLSVGTPGTNFASDLAFYGTRLT